ncbi:MAG: AAA family ATPase [Candidatus Hydrogenedentota bacterium]|uniref:General secretion pathway protein A n=1 Tax=Sumerlaea chitinivorans TaxID=2250252 RepID=A0A2Z4Y931_SUMC1|nr:General secretion pathway protein A [Candidatus Sumerlaea chitinivorans]MCX7963070.1 AAA family ATPase [Candidatus Sumerlaea chitinivorans]RMH24844.1 MAG: AAA family ATPase [Candidatus Hydrogenedentota bacterium]
MYKKFFGLAEEPFNITPDSRFLFLSQRHREALSALIYGVKERKGFILLTGEIGSGKTTVCRAFVNELRAENVKLALILNPGLSELELLKAINDEFQIPSFYNSKKGLVDELNRFLLAENQKGNNVVLVIDEAQNLDPTLLEQIRLLSNLETESEKLLQIVLIGQPELNDTLALSQLEQLNQRIAVRYHITPLTEAETLAYIKHRLFVAGAKVDIEFTPGAMRMLYSATGGVPRRINVVCDRALLACYVDGTYTVDEKIMERAIKEVAGSERTKSPKAKRRSFRESVGDLIDRDVLKRIAKKIALYGIAAAAGVGLFAFAIYLGIRLANVKAVEDPHPKAVAEASRPLPTPAAVVAAKNAASEEENSGDDATSASNSQDVAVKAEPTPTPDWDALRKRNPHWKWERNVPLVRVNNPRAALRAAQFSLLKMWGYEVQLSELAKLGDEAVIEGVLSSDALKVREVRIPGTFSDVVKLNVPVIVRLKDPPKDQSEYVVLLRAEGEAVTVGDPVWGVRTYKTQDFTKRWESALAVFVDVYELSEIQRGEASERVRMLQQYLKSRGYLETVSGKFDVDTVEAIKKFQAYYKLRESGQLDDLTVMLLNACMRPEGPRLSSTGD